MPNRRWGRSLIAEQEQPVRCRGHGGIFICISTTDVVRELPDGLHLGLEVGWHEAPDFAGVHLLAQLRLLPAAGIGVRGVHAGINGRRGGEERKTGLARAVGEVVMVDADDAVGQRLAIRQLHRELRPRVHSGLGLGIRRRGLALRRDVLCHGLLLVQGPVLRVLGDSRLDGRGTGACGAATGRTAALDAGGRPIVHRVADQVELVSDGSRHAGSREHDHQADDGDDQDVLDD